MPNKIHSYRIIGEEDGVILVGANPSNGSDVTKNITWWLQKLNKKMVLFDIK